MLTKNLITMIGMTLIISSTAIFANDSIKTQAPAAVQPKQSKGLEPNEVVDKRNAEYIAEMARKKEAVDATKTAMIENNKENARLLIEHTEKMRTLSINNANEMYNRIVKGHKELQKINEDVINGLGKPLTDEQFKAREEQMKIVQEKAQAEFLALSKAEEENFQAMMKKRQEEAIKKK